MKAYIYFPIPENYHHFFPKNRGGDDHSKPHCTVLFVGEIDKDNVPTLKRILRETTHEHPPIKCSFGKLNHFPVGDDGVPWYVEIDAPPELEALHFKIWDALEEADIPVQHRFPKYVPHATLKYLPEGQEYDGEAPAGEFNVERLELDLEDK